jgi:hypothetical protein
MPDEFADIELVHRGSNEIAGYWADTFGIYPRPESFTVDFIRVDVSESPPTEGVVVARIAISPLTASRLREELQAQWSAYAARSLPEEIRDEALEDEEEG